MTTPTPNARDKEVAAKSYSEYFGNDFSLPTPIGTAIAAYRAEIEANCELRHLESMRPMIESMTSLTELCGKRGEILDKVEKALEIDHYDFTGASPSRHGQCPLCDALALIRVEKGTILP